MQIFRSLAGYSMGRADIVRRAMAKKKHAVMEKERKSFIYGESLPDGTVICEGAVNRGVPEKAAEKIFDDMSAFSSYAFNKSHAAAYAVVAYRTAYLKCHYPKEYFASLFTSVLDSAAKLSAYTLECKRMGIRLLPPAVNESFEGFTPCADGIRFGLSAVKNLGRALIEGIVAERDKNGPYRSMYDFCKRNIGREFNRRALEGLIKSGALDGLESNRRKMLMGIDGVLAVVNDERRFAGEGQLGIFSSTSQSDAYELADCTELPKMQLLKMEKEAAGMYLSGHPMEFYKGFVQDGNYIKIKDIRDKRLTDGARLKAVGVLGQLKVKQLKNNSVIAYTSIEDITGSIDVTVFASAYLAYRPLLEEGNIVILSGRVSEREDRDAEITCDSVAALPENAAEIPVKRNVKSGLYIKIPTENKNTVLKIKEIISEFSGNYEVIIVFADSSKRLKASAGLRVRADKELIAALKELFGEENVKFVP